MQSIPNLIADPIRHYPQATVACFDPTCGALPRRKLDQDLTQRFIDRLEQAGVESVLIGASTGQGHLRTVEELMSWFSCARPTTSSRAMRMGLLRPEDGPAANRKLARCLAENDYSVAFVRPGNDLGPAPSPSEIYQNLAPTIREITDAGLALGVYSIPDVSGYPLPTESVLRILDSKAGERLVAVKITEADYRASTSRFLSEPRFRNLKIVQGWDPHLANAIEEGGAQVGVTSGPMSFAVFQYQHLLSAAEQGDHEEVTQSQQAVTALFAAMQDDPERFANLQIAKQLMGLGHPLLGKIEQAEVERLLKTLRQLERPADRRRLALSLDLMQNGPWHDQLSELAVA